MFYQAPKTLDDTNPFKAQALQEAVVKSRTRQTNPTSRDLLDPLDVIFDNEEVPKNTKKIHQPPKSFESNLYNLSTNPMTSRTANENFDMIELRPHGTDKSLYPTSDINFFRPRKDYRRWFITAIIFLLFVIISLAAGLGLTISKANHLPASVAVANVSVTVTEQHTGTETNTLTNSETRNITVIQMSTSISTPLPVTITEVSSVNVMVTTFVTQWAADTIHVSVKHGGFVTEWTAVCDGAVDVDRVCSTLKP